jgi:hypothetical protein
MAQERRNLPAAWSIAAARQRGCRSTRSMVGASRRLRVQTAVSRKNPKRGVLTIAGIRRNPIVTS